MTFKSNQKKYILPKTFFFFSLARGKKVSEDILGNFSRYFLPGVLWPRTTIVVRGLGLFPLAPSGQLESGPCCPLIYPSAEEWLVHCEFAWACRLNPFLLHSEEPKIRCALSQVGSLKRRAPPYWGGLRSGGVTGDLMQEANAMAAPPLSSQPLPVVSEACSLQTPVLYVNPFPGPCTKQAGSA